MIKLKKYIILLIQLFVGVRKMLIALLFMALGLILLALNQISGTEYIEASRDVVLGFMATNIVEHVAKKIGSWGGKK